MVEAIMADRTVLALFGGLVGGAAGFGLWTVAQRFLPRPTLWLLVAGLAFVGARLMPTVLLPPPPAAGPADTDPSILDPVEPDPSSPQKPLPHADRPTGADQPVRRDVPIPDPYPRGSLDPADVPMLASLSRRDPGLAQLMARELGTGPQSEAKVLDFAMTHGAAAAQGFVPVAADQPILDLAEALAVTTERLLSRDPRACYGWLYGGYGYDAFAFDAFFAATGRGLIDYQMSVYTGLVESAGTDVPAYDEAAANAAISRANFAMTQVAGLDRLEMIAGERAPDGQGDYVAACTARYALLRSLLLEEDAASAIRHLYRLNAR